MESFTPRILRFDSLPSTNSEAASRASEGAPEGLCVVAAEQTAGRGRLDRQWSSPRDAGLYFSVVLRPSLAQGSWPLLTLMTAMAVQDALYEACNLRTDIKWPNDVLAGDKKLCGILAETVETPAGRAVIVGIGINLNQHSFPPELESSATCVEAVSGRKANLEVVLESLVKALAARYQSFGMRDGTISVVREWCARSSYCQGKKIRITDGPNTFEGITRGLESDGALRVETNGGEIKIVRAAEVTSLRGTEN